MGPEERKYSKSYFLAEKYKLIEDNEAAMERYQDCIKINPSEPAAFFELAKILFTLSDLEDAEYYGVRAADLDSQNKWYLYFLIQVYRYQFEYEKEAEIWERLIEIDPLKPEYYFDGSLAYLGFKDYKKALKILKIYEKEIGFSDQVFLMKSKIFEEKGDEKKHLQSLEKGVELFPKSIFLLESLAQYYITKSEYNSANNIYEKIVKIDPSNSTALLASYKILQNKKDKEEEKRILIKIINSNDIHEQKKQELLLAILTNENRLMLYYDDIPTLLKKCIFLYSESSFFYAILADFYSLDKQYELARIYYLKSLDYENASSQLWERIIYMSLLTSKYEQTIEDADTAIEIFPLQGSFFYYKGLAEFYSKSYYESINTLNNALVYIMDDKDLLIGIYETLGNAYHSLAEQEDSDLYHKKSDESYQKALEHDPTNAYILNNYSYYLALRGKNLQLAKEMIERCVSLSETPNPSFLDTYAWVLFKLREYKNAEKMIQKCIQYGGNSSIIHEHYGDILHALDFHKRALIEWDKALEKDPLNIQLEQKILNLKKND
jgi:tetratricopeptide (TPR) repeat protein